MDAEAFRTKRDTFKPVDTWLLGRKAHYHIYRFNRADNQIAMDLLYKVLEAEPESAWAHGLLAWRHTWNFAVNWGDDPEESERLAVAHAEGAIALDPDGPYGYSALANVRFAQGRLEEAISLSEQALERAPGDSEEMAMLATYLQRDMQVDRSVAIFERAVRTNRNAPAWIWNVYGASLRIAGSHAARGGPWPTWMEMPGSLPGRIPPA